MVADAFIILQDAAWLTYELTPCEVSLCTVFGVELCPLFGLLETAEVPFASIGWTAAKPGLNSERRLNWIHGA